MRRHISSLLGRSSVRRLRSHRFRRSHGIASRTIMLSWRLAHSRGNPVASDCRGRLRQPLRLVRRRARRREPPHLYAEKVTTSPSTSSTSGYAHALDVRALTWEAGATRTRSSATSRFLELFRGVRRPARRTLECAALLRFRTISASAMAGEPGTARFNYAQPLERPLAAPRARRRGRSACAVSLYDPHSQRCLDASVGIAAKYGSCELRDFRRSAMNHDNYLYTAGTPAEQGEGVGRESRVQLLRFPSPARVACSAVSLSPCSPTRRRLPLAETASAPSRIARTDAPQTKSRAVRQRCLADE